MSLTSILSYSNKNYKDFRDLLINSFPTPKNKFDQEIQVLPGTGNPALIGRAFDYLLRLKLEKEYKGKSFARPWVAESALEYFKDVDDGPFYLSSKELDSLKDDELLQYFAEKRKKDKVRNKRARDEFKKCRKIHQEFVTSKLKDETDLIRACLFLARLDDLIRVGPEMREYLDFLPETESDIQDLKQLSKNCDLKLFAPKKKLILNPTFGVGSVLVGGADADLIVNDLLIDIKVTKDLRITRPHFNQLIGYYLLYLIGGVRNHKDVSIKHLGIYFARHGVLWTVKIEQIGNEEQFGSAVAFLKGKFKGRVSRMRMAKND